MLRASSRALTELSHDQPSRMHEIAMWDPLLSDGPTHAWVYTGYRYYKRPFIKLLAVATIRFLFMYMAGPR